MRRFLKGDMHAGFSKEKYKVGYCADLYGVVMYYRLILQSTIL